MRQFDTVAATIQYRKPVKPDALPDGFTGLFQAGWEIDHGDFSGEFAMIPATADLWVPSSELVNIVIVEPDEYYRFRKSNNFNAVSAREES